MPCCNATWSAVGFVIDVIDDLGSGETYSTTTWPGRHGPAGQRGGRSCRRQPASAPSGGQPADHQPRTGGGVQSFHLESITAGGDCAVLRVDGEVDAYAAPQIRERVLDLARNGIVHAIADLRGADFLDSAGLGALVGSRTGLRARGGSLTLVASTDRIRQILRITGLSDSFALHSCVLDAITADRHWQAAVTSEGGSTEEWCRKHRLL